MPASRARERGHIDNRPVFVIILILAAIAVPQYLKYLGIDTGELWDRVPTRWTSLLWTTLGVLAAGIAAVIVAAVIEGRKGPFRVEMQDGRRLIHGARILSSTLGALILVLGTVFLASGGGSSGWFSWLVMALGGLLFLISVPMLCGAKRYVVQPGRLAAESRAFTSYTEEWSCAWSENRPVLELTSSTSGGAFGQPLVEHHVVTVDGRPIHEGSVKETAETLVALLRQAIEEAGEETTARRSA